MHCVWCSVAKWRPTLCNPVDCSLPGSSVHGIFQAEYWSGFPFASPGDLPDPWIEPMSLASPALGGRFFTHWPIREAPNRFYLILSCFISKDWPICKLGWASYISTFISWYLFQQRFSKIILTLLLKVWPIQPVNFIKLPLEDSLGLRKGKIPLTAHFWQTRRWYL